VLDALLAEGRDDDNVVGVVVFGSRGKGAFVTEASDWDVFVVVREHRGERPFVHGAKLETVEVTLDELRNQPARNRYSLTWLEPQLDKTGEVAIALREAVRVDPTSAAEPLDGYVNMLYRSLKNARVGLELASLLDAQESIPWFLEFVFAVHGRLRPYNKWLEWELETHLLPWNDLPRLGRIARTGDPMSSVRCFARSRRSRARTVTAA
jgi:predicted nucleotidyltransferase